MDWFLYDSKNVSDDKDLRHERIKLILRSTTFRDHLLEQNDFTLKNGLCKL